MKKQTMNWKQTNEKSRTIELPRESLAISRASNSLDILMAQGSGKDDDEDSGDEDSEDRRSLFDV